MVIVSINKSKIYAVLDLFKGERIVSQKSKLANIPNRKPENEAVFVLTYNQVNHANASQSETVIAIEDGIFSDHGHYYINDICCIKDSDGYRFGCGNFIEISKNMYDCIRNGISLKDIIVDIKEEDGDASKGGVIGFLTDGALDRKKQAKYSIKSALGGKKIRIFDTYHIDRKTFLSNNSSPNFQRLDQKCKEVLDVLKEKRGKLR